MEVHSRGIVKDHHLITPIPRLPVCAQHLPARLIRFAGPQNCVGDADHGESHARTNDAGKVKYDCDLLGLFVTPCQGDFPGRHSHAAPRGTPRPGTGRASESGRPGTALLRGRGRQGKWSLFTSVKMKQFYRFIQNSIALCYRILSATLS